MKARTFSIIADDDNLAVKVTVSVTPRKGYPLEEPELDQFVKKASRKIAALLTELPFSDFGIENTWIEHTRIEHTRPRANGWWVGTHLGRDSVPEPGAPTPTDAQHDSVRQQAEEIARSLAEASSRMSRAIAELKAELERVRPSANAPDISTDPPKI
jgi:hypothetical protein